MHYISPLGEYPRYYGDIMAEHPEWELGQELPSVWIEVEETPMPELTDPDNLTITLEQPVEVDGKLVQTWGTRELTAEEKEALAAPRTAKEKLEALGLTSAEIKALFG